jgi:hypothetical protein
MPGFRLQNGTPVIISDSRVARRKRAPGTRRMSAARRAAHQVPQQVLVLSAPPESSAAWFPS